MYNDIKKVCDSVSHQILVRTLFQYRLNESIVKWFKEFLPWITKVLVTLHCQTL